MFSKIISIALLLGYTVAVEPNPPHWDTSKVKIFKPGQGNAQSILDGIHRTQGGQNPGNNGQFSNNRYALLFEPG